MRYHKKAGYDISILSILGIDSFFEQREIHKNTKHGTFIAATFDYITFVQVNIVPKIDRMFIGYSANCGSRKLRYMRPASIPPRKTSDSAGHCLSSYNYHMTRPLQKPRLLRICMPSLLACAPSSRDYHRNDVRMSMNIIIKPHYVDAWAGLLDPIFNCPENSYVIE